MDRISRSDQTTTSNSPAAPATPLAPRSMPRVALMHDLRQADYAGGAALLSPTNAAEKGVSGPGAALPHRARLEAGFGADLSGVAAHTGPEAQTAARSLGAKAYAMGDRVAFADPSPSASVVAHEVAHVVQSRGAGATENRVSRPGEGVEQQAHAAADAVLSGGKAAPVAGGPVPAVSRYSERSGAAQQPDEWPSGDDLRVADDGKMAVGQSGGYGSHDFWLEASLVSSFNATLKGKESVIQLADAGSTLSGAAPDGSGKRTLTKVLPTNTSNRTSGDSMQLWADCGRSARDVTGVGRGTGNNHSEMGAVYNKPTQGPEKRDLAWWERLFVSLGWMKDPNANANADKKVEEKETSASGPGEMKLEVWQQLLGGTPSAAQARYEGMSAKERDEFDKAAGINRHAAPEVGEGFTMSTGGPNYPGARTWNFHWAGVVAKSGGDRVSLENYAVGDPEAKNNDWEFQMYGPPSKAGQTFHDQHKATKQHGQDPTTMRVRKR